MPYLPGTPGLGSVASSICDREGREKTVREEIEAFSAQGGLVVACFSKRIPYMCLLRSIVSAYSAVMMQNIVRLESVCRACTATHKWKLRPTPEAMIGPSQTPRRMQPISCARRLAPHELACRPDRLDFPSASRLLKGFRPPNQASQRRTPIEAALRACYITLLACLSARRFGEDRPAFLTVEIQ